MTPGIAGRGESEHSVSGSHRDPVRGARRTGDAPADEEVLFSIILRRRQGGRAPVSPEQATPAEVRERYDAEAGADPSDIRTVEAFLRGAGMQVVRSDLGRRTVLARCTVAQARATFGVSLGRYEGEGISYRGREGDVQIPAELTGIVEAVLGLDDRPQARIHLKRGDRIDRDLLPSPSDDPLELLFAGQAEEPALAPRAARKPRSLWPMQVAGLYEFPPEVDGTGVTIGIIELGGGFEDQELDEYFARAGVPRPEVIAMGVDGGENLPGQDPDADGEVMLDIEVSGAVAPGARIVVYFADPSDRGFLDAVSTAMHDQTYAPSVISISWGGPEDAWGTQGLNAFDDLLSDADALGVTILAAAGDHGGGDATGDGKVHADFPASSPHVVGCGGTTLVGSSDGISSEVSWNDQDGWATGGGVSGFFPRPDWQRVSVPPNLNGTGVEGRGVPDVAGNADITSGYVTLSDGHWAPVGGTSAVAPLYSGLLALITQSLGRPIGTLLQTLYSSCNHASVFADVTQGGNSVPKSQFGPATAGYRAGIGWDACTGLGSIRGSGLLACLGQSGSSASEGMTWPTSS